MTPMPEPTLPHVRDIMGETITIVGVVDNDGTPLIVLKDGRTFSCAPESETKDWASRCATFFQGELAANGAPIEVTVIEKAGQVGFTE